MTPNTSLERRLGEYYTSEPPLRAPDRVLLSALATIDITPQRRGLLAPGRFMTMPTYGKLAAAVAVVAVVAFGVWQLAPRAGSGGTPVPTASRAPAPSSAPTTSPTNPGPSPYVPGPLTETFTSAIHGIKLSYPVGWTTDPATEPWTGDGFPLFGMSQGDRLYDPTYQDHLFVGLASQPLGGASFEAWSTAVLAGEDCVTEPGVVDGVEGIIGTECTIALVSKSGRGYAIFMNTSSDEAVLDAFDSGVLFREILATVQLKPGDAVD